MRYLGLDLGTKTCGVAISDRTNTLASFVEVIRFKFEDYDSVIPRLREIIEKNGITHIALGFPKNMDNSEGFAAERSLKFKKMIESNFDVEVILIDERLTTTQAENILIGMDKRREQRKKVIDGVSAVLILESFIEGRNMKDGQ